jgi:hypothetical protein
LSQDNTITLLQELDQTIQNIEQYSNQKEAKIDSLKKQFKYSKSDNQNKSFLNIYMMNTACTNQIQHLYMKKNVALAIHLREKTNQAYLDLASIMGTLGMYGRLLIYFLQSH